MVLSDHASKRGLPSLAGAMDQDHRRIRECILPGLGQMKG
jgi:hypothetical protein